MKSKTEPVNHRLCFLITVKPFFAQCYDDNVRGLPDASSLPPRIRSKSDAYNDPSESYVVFPGSSECPINSPKESVIDIFKKLRYSVPHGAGV